MAADTTSWLSYLVACLVHLHWACSYSRYYSVAVAVEDDAVRGARYETAHYCQVTTRSAAGNTQQGKDTDMLRTMRLRLERVHS